MVGHCFLVESASLRIRIAHPLQTMSVQAMQMTTATDVLVALLKLIVFFVEITIAVEMVYVWLKRVKTFFTDFGYDLRPLGSRPDVRLGLQRNLTVRDVWRVFTSLASFCALVGFAVAVYWYDSTSTIIEFPFWFLFPGVVLLVIWLTLKLLARHGSVFIWNLSQSVKSLLTFLFTWLVYVPAMILNEQLVERAQPGLWDDFGYMITYLLPNQLFSDLFQDAASGYAEVRVIFTIAFLGLTLSLYHLVRSIMRSGSKAPYEKKFLVREWDTELSLWVEPSHVPTEEAVFLVHGFASDLTKWHKLKPDSGDEVRLVDEATKAGFRVLAVNLSNQLRTGLRFDYRVKKKKESYPFVRSDSLGRMSNFKWELLYALYLAKHELGVKRIHMITHSTGGIISRMALVDTESLLEELMIDDLVQRVTWLAVPHRGSRAATALMKNVSSPWRPSTWVFLAFGLLLKLIPFNFVKNAIDSFGVRIVAMALDAQTGLDLWVGSRFLADLNGHGRNVVVISPATKWRNAYGKYDSVVGDGAIMQKRDFDFHAKKQLGTVEQRCFDADHAAMAHEEIGGAMMDIPSIHRSREVCEWIFN